MSHAAHRNMQPPHPTYTPSADETIAELSDRLIALERYMGVFFCEEDGEYESVAEEDPAPLIADATHPDSSNYSPPVV